MAHAKKSQSTLAGGMRVAAKWKLLSVQQHAGSYMQKRFVKVHPDVTHPHN